MQIFKAEIDDGLSHLLSAKSSISYASIAQKSEQTFCTKPNDMKALAGIEDKDLYYAQSILVTTTWNRNDDIFDKDEVWAAKNTPIHKPTNLEHNEGIIVGHITSNWPITDDGMLIDPSTPIENLPNKYHILTGSVIYTGYTEPELKARSEQLIAEIEDGSKYVSMECFFKGFNYGLINKSTGEYKILGRNEETAFLTKHLRAYGGFGEYEDHKIGRVLKDITFSGKGFVSKPANPESIIFTKNNLHFDKQVSEIEIKKEKTDDFSNMGVFSNQANLKETDMSLEKEVSEIKEKVEAMAVCKEAVAEAQTLASDLQSKNSELTTQLTELTASLEQKEEAAKKMEEVVKTKDEEMKKMKAELDSANEVLAAYKDKEDEMMKKEKKMKRMASLLETGFTTELATSTVEKFENLDDDAFASMTEIFAVALTEQQKKDQLYPKKLMKQQASEEGIENVLETAETEEAVALSVGSEESANNEVETTRAALIDFVYNRLGKKLNKGE